MGKNVGPTATRAETICIPEENGFIPSTHLQREKRKSLGAISC